MKTKEQIISEYWGASDGFNTTYSYKEMELAMEEYAKEVVIKELQSILGSVHPEYLPEIIQERLVELKSKTENGTILY